MSCISRTDVDSRLNLVYKVFHRVRFVRNKTIGSNASVILNRQTCGQRSSLTAGRERRALAFTSAITQRSAIASHSDVVGLIRVMYVIPPDVPYDICLSDIPSRKPYQFV